MALWEPLWKGLGMQEVEELPAPDSFGSDFDNSIKKHVSFALKSEDEAEHKKKWKWRRKQRKSKKPVTKCRQQKYQQEASLHEFSDGDSYDSFEERAKDHRDEKLDDDLWEGSDDTREEEEQGNGLWTAFFNFGDNETDFEDGWTTEGEWTEGDSTHFTGWTATTHSTYDSQEVQRNSSTVSSLNSDEEGGAIEVVNQSNRSLKTTDTPPSETKDDAQLSPSSCLEPGRIGWKQGDGTLGSSRNSVPDEIKAEVPIVPDAGDHVQGQLSTNGRTPGDPDKYAVAEKKKKKKMRWKVRKGKAERDNVPETVDETPPLDPIAEDERDDAAPPQKTKFGVEEGDRGTAHKSCMPHIFNGRHPRVKEPIGRLLCRSARSPTLTKQNSITSDVTSKATSQDSSPPMVRIICDTQGNQGPAVVANASEHNESDIHRQMQLEESQFAASQGPQSIYTYDYESGTHMDVNYKHYGDDPEDVLNVREYDVPLALFPGTNDVVVMVEASTISLSDCRIREGNWWGYNLSPLPNCPGVDLVGKVHSINDRTRKKYRLKEGDRVMSLVKWGGNSRYSRTKADQLVKIPKSVDPVEATCLAESYLAAFQALQYNQSSWARYSGQSLIGKSVLVIGGMTNTGHAVVELAIALGAMEVFATSKERHHSKFSDLGATPIERKPKLWPPELMGTIDIVIDATGDVAGDHANVTHFRALHKQGILIFIGLRDMTDAVAKEWDVTSTLLDSVNTDDLVNRTHSLEVFDNWDLDLERSKNDLEFLLRLLEQELIKPKVRDVLPLAKVAKAQTLLETKSVQGYLVCEPWIKSKSRAVYL